MGIDGTIPQLTYCRAPWKGQHSHPCSAALLVARDVYLGGTICSWLCNLPTEQNTHHQEENTPLSHSQRPLNVPVQHCSLRPHHAAAQSQQIWCYPHHHGPRMFPSCYLPPLSHDNHWRGSSPVVPQAPVPVVRSSFKGNLQPRPSLYIPFCMSIDHKAKHRKEYQYSIPPTDWQTYGMKKPMGGAVPPSLHFCKAGWLGSMAPHCDLHTQLMA